LRYALVHFVWAKRDVERLRRRIPVLRVPRERLLKHLEEPSGQRVFDLEERVDPTIADGEEDGELAAAREERLAEEHLGQHRRRAEEVRAVIERLTGDLLGREVGELPFEDGAGRVSQRGARRRARDPEVTELHLAVAREIEVRRRHVAMNDPERRPLLVLRGV